MRSRWTPGTSRRCSATRTMDTGVQNEATRKVAENTKAIAADDVAGDDAKRRYDPVTDPTTQRDNVGGGYGHRPRPQRGPDLGYTLEGADAARSHRGATGQIEVGAGTKLDYETKDTYMVTVTAEDSFGDSAPSW